MLPKRSSSLKVLSQSGRPEREAIVLAGPLRVVSGEADDDDANSVLRSGNGWPNVEGT